MEIFMRKILLATTALVAVAGVSASNADVSFTGGSAFLYNTWSDDTTNDAANGVNDNSFGSDTTMSASWSSTTDSGLSISMTIDLVDMTAGTSIGGDFGTIRFDDGGGGAGDAGAGDADVTPEASNGDNSFDFTGGESINGGVISYTSPDFNGFNFSVGSTNGGSSSLTDETSMSIAYSVSVNGADVSLGYASGNSGADNSSGTSIDKNATSINASIGIGDITFSLAQNKVSGDNSDDNATQEYDISSNEYGVEYALNDSITLSAESRAVSGTATAGADYKHDQTGYGIAYTVASGVVLSGTFTDFTNSNGTTDVSGTATVIKLAVSF
jgi:hypothetical protein